MKWLLIALLLSSMVLAEPVNKYTTVEHFEDYSIAKISAFPEYYYEGGWQEINTTITDAAGTSDYNVLTMQNKLFFKKRPSSKDMVKISQLGYSLSFIPSQVGYVSSEGEEVLRTPSTQQGYYEGSSVIFPNYFGEGITLNYTVTSTELRKEFIIAEYGILPNASPSLFPPWCAEVCQEIPIWGFVDYEIERNAGGAYRINGVIWDENTALFTNESIALVDSLTNTTLYEITPPYAIGNYTGAALTHTYSSQGLYRDGQKRYLRQLFTYNTLHNPANYPLLLDPTVTIDNATLVGSRVEAGTCTAGGNCCSFRPGGTCTHNTPFDPDCYTQTPHVGITRDTTACTACNPAFPCCTLQGSFKDYVLAGFELAEAIATDHNQVVVNEANVYVEVNNGAGDFRARHHDDNSSWPECRENHDVDSSSQPAVHQWLILDKHNFTFTDHVQAELRSAPSEWFFVLFDSTSNNVSSNNLILDLDLNINYSIDQCRAPYFGRWNLSCDACSTINNMNVTGNTWIYGDSADDTLTINGTWNYPSAPLVDRYIYLNGSCTVLMTENGGIN